MKVKIYCLYDPLSCKIRYIGRTRKPIEIRLIEHISKSRYYSKYFPSRNPPHKVNWINSLLNQNREPKIKLLTKIEGWSESYIFETNLIGKYKDKFDLLNAQDRGKGKESRITTEETRLLISKTLKNKHEKNEIKKKVTPVYIFNNNGKLIHTEESITSASIYFNIHRRGIDSKIKSKKSIDGLFLSKSNKLNLNDYLYLYNFNSKEIKIFSTFLEIIEFLKISEFIYKKLDKNKKQYKGWIINSLEPNLEEKVITLYKNKIEYNFKSVKDVSKHIGCTIYSVYELLKGTTKSLYNYKTINT